MERSLLREKRLSNIRTTRRKQKNYKQTQTVDVPPIKKRFPDVSVIRNPLLDSNQTQSAVVTESETSNSEEPCVCINPIIYALKEHFIFILNEEPEPPTPIEKINGLYGLDDGHYTSAIRELIKESKRDEELKKYLFAYLCDNYGENVTVVDKNISLINYTLTLSYILPHIYNKLLQLNFITDTDDKIKNTKSYRDWFKIYSCGPNRKILKELNDKVEANEILQYFEGIGLTPQINNLEHARKLKEIVKDIIFYLVELRMTNFEYIGFNIQNYAGVLDTLHTALKDMYEIEHRLFAKLMWDRDGYSVVDFLIVHYFKCMDWILDLKKHNLNIDESFKRAITSTLENDPDIENKTWYPDIKNISDFQTEINKRLTNYKPIYGSNNESNNEIELGSNRKSNSESNRESDESEIESESDESESESENGSGQNDFSIINGL